MGEEGQGRREKHVLELKQEGEQDIPDRDRQRDAKLAEDERVRQNEEIAAQAAKKQQEEQHMTQGERRKALDIRDMSEYRLSETEAPWITDLTNEQMGNIAAW
eukprot:849773-Heterocapsa_arctica.AAC.1